PLYRGLVRIGEKIGSLDLIFSRLARYLAENKKIKERIVGALIYPLIIFVLILGGIVAMTFFVFPIIGNLFSQFGPEQVAAIQSRLLLYNVVMGVLLSTAVLSGIGVAILGGVRRRGGNAGVAIDRLLLKLPLAGRIILYRESMNFLFAMETLTGSGYSIESALTESAHVLKNQALKQAVLKIRERIVRGDSIAEAFQEEKVFPERISQWLYVGERSGQVEKVFAQLSGYYQGEIDKWATRFMAWIEPALMLFVGAFVFIFVVLFILPLFSMYGTILR
ncbi:MAG TPA: hypothetical protein ENN69_06195, partial [Spirochaetia bacterium]|nr:hypothetical protein [Spirochaetia bacterium]